MVASNKALVIADSAIYLRFAAGFIAQDAGAQPTPKGRSNLHRLRADYLYLSDSNCEITNLSTGKQHFFRI
jgi:hypothetical protein